MEIIPIVFEYQGTEFNGKLHKITGEQGAVWYSLFIGEYLYGQLFNSEQKGWVFQSNRGMFEEKQFVDLFVSAIQAWKN